MKTIALQNWQRQAFSIEICRMLTPACFFKAVVQACRNTVTKAGRLIHNLITTMQAFIVQYLLHSTTIDVILGYYNGGSLVSTASVNVANPNPFTDGLFRDAINTGVLADAAGKSYSLTAADIVHNISPTAFMNNAPQAAIADCPADAVTNYNVITTLLGSLTGAVNAANTKQNEIATKLNSLLAANRVEGLILP